jgi:hypothetical protein
MLSTLAVFVDGWTIEAATRVAELNEDRTLDLIEALARQSLVRVDPTAHEPRFRMLETVREFIAEQSATNPDLADVQRRHANFFRDQAERADRPLRGVGQPEWAERLQVENANLGAAVRWFLAHDIEPLPHLFRVLWLFWAMRDHLIEVRSWIDELTPAVTSLDDHAQAEFFWSAALTGVQHGDDTAAVAAKGRLEPLLGGFDDTHSSKRSHTWPWRGSCRSSTTSTARCEKPRCPVSTCAIKTSPSGPPSLSTPSGNWNWRSGASTMLFLICGKCAS